jgi:hypothetical protein
MEQSCNALFCCSVFRDKKQAAAKWAAGFQEKTDAVTSSRRTGWKDLAEEKR